MLCTSFCTRDRNLEAFLQTLREFGYAEGKNIAIEYRGAEGKLDEFAAELVRLKVDVIVVRSGRGGRAAQKATRSIPIVMAFAGDPVGDRLVDNLAHPGGNVTGVSSSTADLAGKRLELLKELIPGVFRVSVLWNSSSSPQFKEIEVVGRALGLELQSLEVQDLNDLEKALATATKERADALLTLSHPFISFHRKRIVAVTAKNRLPNMYHRREFVEDGGLMSYGPSRSDLYRRAAFFVDKILRGAKPADLPVEQPIKFELVINLKTAKEIGVTIAPEVLMWADEVIK